MIKLRLFLVGAVLLGFLAVAQADTMFFFNVGAGGKGAGGGGGGCGTGVVDLSAGCPLPMLGGF
jgi:hypothetical protein